MDIAIIGAGISGIGAAQALDSEHKITIFESKDSIGGHSNTIQVNELNIDTGFIVYNNRNYPGFSSFLKELCVKSSRTSMSFSYSDNDLNIEYAGSKKGLLPRLTSIFDSKHIGMMWSIYKYSVKLEKFKYRPFEKNLSIIELLKSIGCPLETIERYFLPIASAIWSCDTKNVRNIPAKTYIQFFSNHGLLNLTKRPQWYSIDNGSQSYLKAFQDKFTGNIETKTKIISCTEMPHKIVLKSEDYKTYDFDLAILATPANKSDLIYQGNNRNLNRILSSYKYSSNNVVLHSDTDFMPSNKRIWASWNFVSQSGTKPKKDSYVTYYMNQLQNLVTDIPYFVTLNPPNSPKSEKVIFQTQYSHPMLIHDEKSNEQNFAELNSQNQIYFCGSYLGYGFHEDGFSSGVKVAQLINSRKINTL